jgi:catechol 2,3-dioxygenase-like lactoylglutathione lyase family enzyme
MSHIQSANVTIMVSSLDTSIKFYTELLGFALKGRYGDHWADLSGFGLDLGLHPTTKQIDPGTNLQIGLRVADLDAAMNDLAGKGINFQKQEDEQVRIATFHDPDGNTLYLVQPEW